MKNDLSPASFQSHLEYLAHLTNIWMGLGDCGCLDGLEDCGCLDGLGDCG